MADYKKQGGVLSGREERHDGFAGEPKTIGTGMGTGATHGQSMISGVIIVSYAYKLFLT